MKKLVIATILLTLGACGLNRPFPPTISYLTGDAYTRPYASPSGQYDQYGQYGGGYVVADYLENVQLNWDVSNVPGANGAMIIASREYTCETEIASVYKNIVSTAQRNQLLYHGVPNPEENMRTLFNASISQFTAGTYFICVRAVKMGKEGPPSTPVTLELTQNQIPYYLNADDVDEEDNPYNNGYIEE